MPLNAKTIDAAKTQAAEEDRRVEVWDDTGKFVVRALHARVTPSGVVSFFVRYRSSGRFRRYRIGGYPEMTVDQARKEAKGIINAADKGEDPQGQKEKRRELDRTTPTVKEAVDLYLEQLTLAPRTIATYRQRLTKFVVPALGKKSINEVGPADVRRLHKKIKQLADKPVPKGKRQEGGAVAANRTVETLRALYTWAMVEYPEVVKANPARFDKQKGFKKHDESETTHTITAEQRTALLAAIDECEAKPPKTAGHISKTYANAFRLIVMLGLRPNDACTLRFENIHRGVSQGRKVWVAQWTSDRRRGDATKVKNTQRELNSAAIAIIEAQEKITGGKGWVFPNSAGGQTTTGQLDRSFRAVRVRADLPEHCGLYVCGRHSFVTAGVEAGVPLAVMGEVVANKSAVHRYAHLESAAAGMAERVLVALQGGASKR